MTREEIEERLREIGILLMEPAIRVQGVMGLLDERELLQKLLDDMEQAS